MSRDFQRILWTATFLAWLVTIVLWTLTIHADNEFRVTSGIVSSSDIEEAEGYFGVGQGVVIMVLPGSVPQDIMKARKGKVVELVIREVAQ